MIKTGRNMTRKMFYSAAFFSITFLGIGIIPIWDIKCINCNKHLYNAVSIEMILSPPSVTNPVCFRCLISTAKIEGEGKSVKMVRKNIYGY